MIRSLKFIPILAAIGLSSASAANIPLDSAPNTQVRSILNVVFADYLRDRVGVEVQNAAVDLDGDGVGEIIARFVHTSSCDAGMKLCRTVIIRHARKQWQVVYDRFADGIEVLEGPKRVPRPIRAHNVRWNWNAGVYIPTSEGLGDDVVFTPIPREQATSYASVFGEGASELLNAGGNVTISYGASKLTDKNDTLILKLTGQNVCGEISGCPVRVLKQDGETWKPVLQASSIGEVLIGKAARNGHVDVVVETNKGFAVMGWSGDSYAVADRIEKVR